MKTKWILFSIILIRCVFIGFPDIWVAPFPFSDNEIPLSSYVWALFEHATLMAICWQWWRETGSASVAAFVLMVAYDMLDFMANMNTAYLTVSGYHVTNNVLMLIAYPMLTWMADETVKHDISR